ncbi:MAG: hypothetical protein V4631_15960 [Pseudomonadota bacterium]
MHEKRIAYKYFRELGGSFLIYFVMLVLTIIYGRAMPEGILRTLVLASPMVGFFLATWAIARHLKRIDEYLRQYTLENIAIAFAVTAGLTFTYGFMETAGYPKLSMFSVWMVMGAVWFISTIARGIMNR